MTGNNLYQYTHFDMCLEVNSMYGRLWFYYVFLHGKVCLSKEYITYETISLQCAVGFRVIRHKPLKWLTSNLVNAFIVEIHWISEPWLFDAIAICIYRFDALAVDQASPMLCLSSSMPRLNNTLPDDNWYFCVTSSYSFRGKASASHNHIEDTKSP